MSTSSSERFREYSAPTRALAAATGAKKITTTDAAIMLIGVPATDTIIGVTRADVRRLYAATLYDPALKLSVPAAARSLDHLIDDGHTTYLMQASGRGEDPSDYTQWSLARRIFQMLSALIPLSAGYGAIIHGLDINDPRLITIGAIVNIAIYLVIGLKGLGSYKDIPALDFGNRKDRTLVADIVDAADYLDTETQVIDIADEQLAEPLTALQNCLASLEIQLVEEPELDSATTAAARHELWSDYEKLTTSLPGLNATITEKRISHENAAIIRAVDSMLTRYWALQDEIDEHRDLILEARSEIAELTTTPALEQIESLSRDYVPGDQEPDDQEPDDQNHDLGELNLDNVAEQPQPARTTWISEPFHWPSDIIDSPIRGESLADALLRRQERHQRDGNDNTGDDDSEDTMTTTS